MQFWKSNILTIIHFCCFLKLRQDFFNIQGLIWLLRPPQVPEVMESPTFKDSFNAGKGGIVEPRLLANTIR